MQTISLCMIVKNEEDVLGRCLDSVKGIVDEIIIVDTGSDDRTKEVAAKYTDLVFDFPWIDDFSAARNFSFAKAGKDYLMWLDADDVISDKDREKFLELKAQLQPDVDMVMMRYHIAFDTQGKPTFSYFRERLMRREKNFRWAGAIHEAIAPAGKVVYWDCAVCHRKLHPGDPDRNLRIFESMLAQGKVLEPREEFYYARELFYHQRYEEAVAVWEAYLAAGSGWRENCISACQDLANCYEQMGESGKVLPALLYSFAFGRPRAEICCDIGRYFFLREDYPTAAYWYETALSCRYDDTTGGFFRPECYGFLPAIQLCVCYDRMGDTTKALAYHKQAKAYRPQAPEVLYNEAYFMQKEAESRGR